MIRRNDQGRTQLDRLVMYSTSAIWMNLAAASSCPAAYRRTCTLTVKAVQDRLLLRETIDPWGGAAYHTLSVILPGTAPKLQRHPLLRLSQPAHIPSSRLARPPFAPARCLPQDVVQGPPRPLWSAYPALIRRFRLEDRQCQSRRGQISRTLTSLSSSCLYKQGPDLAHD